MGTIIVKSDELTPSQLELARQEVERLQKTESIIGVLYLISKMYSPAKLSYENGGYVITIGA